VTIFPSFCYQGVQVSVDLEDFKESGKHVYSIQQRASGSGTNCAGSGDIYDPYGEKYATSGNLCSQSNPGSCMAGDLSGKNGELLKNPSSQTATAFFTDSSLTFMDLYGKAILIRSKDATILACADIGIVLILFASSCCCCCCF